MIELLTLPLQFIILSFLVRDADIRKVALLVSVAFTFSYMTIGDPYFYIRNGLIDVYLLLAISFILDVKKRYLLYFICGISLFMNIYEGMSYYQTFIYPYRDVIQWWMVEFMFIILAWKCEWRVLNVKFGRDNY